MMNNMPFNFPNPNMMPMPMPDNQDYIKSFEERIKRLEDKVKQLESKLNIEPTPYSNNMYMI